MKKYLFVFLTIMATLGVVYSDPELFKDISSLPLSIITLANTISYTYFGFMLAVYLPDKYLDNEFTDQQAKAIVVLSLSIIYSVALSSFIS